MKPETIIVVVGLLALAGTQFSVLWPQSAEIFAASIVEAIAGLNGG